MPDFSGNPGDAVLGTAETARLLGFSRPVALLTVAVLHYITPQVQTGMHRYRDALAPWSAVVISTLTADEREEEAARVELYFAENTATQVTFRTRDEVRAMFDGTELVPPGVVWDPAVASRSDRPPAAGNRTASAALTASIEPPSFEVFPAVNRPASGDRNRLPAPSSVRHSPSRLRCWMRPIAGAARGVCHVRCQALPRARRGVRRRGMRPARRPRAEPGAAGDRPRARGRAVVGGHRVPAGRRCVDARRRAGR
ncbi:hypothetical protein E1202_17980 [Saccharopolyspora karakumensis]|uniref:S-adenosyl methyltransferase n=1 Tax=Saccharopolyspora karakumensis TaxID=2530386 RepID=A0A4R5BRL1_9PSEU|nr:hypothetical protein E1202_17980 [Saccharopolyspora karakumensis]